MQHETRIVVEPAEPVPLETTPPEVITPSISVAPQPVVRGLGAKRRKRAQNERYRERQRSKGLKRLVFTIPASAVEWVSAMTSEIIDCYISAMMPVIEVSGKLMATPVSPASASEVSRAISRQWALEERWSESSETSEQSDLLDDIRAVARLMKPQEYPTTGFDREGRQLFLSA